MTGPQIVSVTSAFNCQSARVVVLFEQAHKNFWDIVMRTLRERVPAEKFDGKVKE